MRHVRTIALLASGIVVAMLSWYSTRPSAAPGSAPVTVVNTPLPVTGTVAVSNLPAVAPLQAYQVQCRNTLDFADNISECFFEAVPAGKRLLVQTISIHTLTDPGVRVVQGAFTDHSTILWLNVPLTGTVPSGCCDVSQMTQDIHYFINGGGTSAVSVLYNKDTTQNELIVTVVGYLENMP